MIAICAALERARWGVWDQPAALTPVSYIEAVQRAGAIAVMLPPTTSSLPIPGRRSACSTG